MKHGIEADLIVVGGGVAGRMAALAAARAGQDVVLLDDGTPPPLPGVRICARRTVWTVTPGFIVEALGPNGRETYRAPRLVSATGSLPRMIPFPGWTLRGVGALGDRSPGRRIVLAGTGPELARQAAKLGRRVVAVADLAQGQTIGAAYGNGHIERVKIVDLSPTTRARFIAADTILMGYGAIPRNDIQKLLGPLPGLGEKLPLPRGEGWGEGVPTHRAISRSTPALMPVEGSNPTPTPPWHHLIQHLPPTVEICPCEHLTRADLDAAIADGATDMNQLRAFTRCGMGACQGRLCGPAASALVPGEWTVRPPLRPIPLQALLGHYTYADIPVPTPAPL